MKNMAEVFQALLSGQKVTVDNLPQYKYICLDEGALYAMENDGKYTQIDQGLRFSIC